MTAKASQSEQGESISSVKKDLLSIDYESKSSSAYTLIAYSQKHRE